MSPHRPAVLGRAAIELALIGVTALCVADIHCR
ncbi:Ms4533A family Cys-rich leader peptide [Streptomyces sp. SID4917]